MRARDLAAALVCLLAAGSGCSKCGGSHPYVPYAIGEGGVGASDEDAGAAEATAGDAGAFFAAVPALLAPPNVSDWTVDGLRLVAPPDTLFGSAVARDFDGDGLRDAFAIVQKAGSIEEIIIVYYKGLADGKVGAGAIVNRPSLDDGPCPVPPNGTDAKTMTHLFVVGAHAVLAEVALPCLHGSTRLLRVASAEKGNVRDRFDLMIDDPAGQPPLAFEADASDLDGDGIDDVALRVTIDSSTAPFEPAPKTTATMKWFDRPAGLSRDPEEPDASLRRVTSSLLTKSKTKDAASVPAAARQVRALYAAICQEGGSPRMAIGSWRHGISCGPSHALEDAGVAEARAYANTGDVLRALVARDRAEAPPSTHTPQRAADADAAIAAAAPTVNQATLRAVSAIPQIHRTKGPAWGALAFDDANKLLVRTLAGVVRVDPAQGDESAATDVATWPNDVVSPDGTLRFLEAYSPCSYSLHATIAPVGAAELSLDVKDVPLPIESPLGVACSGAKGNPVSAIPVSWGPSGLEAIVAREPIVFAADWKGASAIAQFASQPSPHGSPRSPDGKSICLPSFAGIVVKSDRTRIFKAPELEGGYGELRDCTVSNDGVHVACVRGGRAFVGTWALP